MTLDQGQLDWIVREVVRRLQAMENGSAPSDNGASTGGAQPSNCKELTLCDRVVTMRSVEGRLDGVAVLRIDRQAIVTPAVRDVLVDRCIALARGKADAVAEPRFVGMRTTAGRDNCDQCWRH